MNFGHPSQLPTPPDTDADVLVGARHPIDLMNAPGLNISDQDTNPQPSVSAPFRRVSTLAYHNSPLRDPRDRLTGRQSRWLIVVIPPASLVQDHGPLGHTLTSGPTQRLSQGILMPLQPTMYGQLTAIAREFNFPSPVGLCLYLHVTEQGISMAPRISDDIWPTLWGHLFESRSPGPSFQMPICGRVEFDIDRRRALWLNSWLTSDRRHAVDVQVSVPPSLSHHRGDSRTSFFDDRGDERPEDPSMMRTTSRSRHIPKKLSLVDRFETLSFTSSLANAITGSDTVGAPSNPLATVLDEKTKPAKIALEKRVESWRASSSPSPMAKPSQIPLDPENIPNNLQLSDCDVLADTEEEINLNDFAWSATSLGPLDYDSLPSAVSGSQVLSVHLDRRLEGSALLTPSIATSWGPESLDSPPMSILFRLPSPDIAQRVIEDCPNTPSTATSWGPEELLYSPASVKFRLPSPDLGQRMVEDCPPTPSTATSWGPEELLYSPASVEFRLHSPDLGQRMLEDCPPTPITGASWRIEHSRPAISTILRYPRKLDMCTLSIWPYTPSITTCCVPIAKTSMSGASRTVEPGPSGHVYPYISATSRPTWTLVWPLYIAENVSNPLPLQFPHRCLTWTFIWPLYKAGNASSPLPSQFPDQNLADRAYDATRLHFRIFPERTSVTEESFAPIWFDPLAFTRRILSSLDTSVYPSLDEHDGQIYGACSDLGAICASLEGSYPTLAYSLVYPYFCVHLPPLAALDIKQEVGPSNTHNSKGHLELGTLPVRLPPIYPSIELYPPQYPFITPYGHRAVPPFSEMDRTPGSAIASTSRQALSSGQAPLYPAFDIYPAVAGHSESGISFHLPQVYPRIIPYPAVYPELDLYPPVSAETGGIPKTGPSVYQVYPSHVSAGQNDITISRIAPLLQPVYPRFDIYPAVYPCFDIYRADFLKMEDQRVSLSVMLPTQYPAFNLYPATYPHFEFYPPVTEAHGILASKHSMLVNTRIPSPRRARKTHRELHEEVFAPVKVFVEQPSSKPSGEIKTRRPISSRTTNARPALPQAASAVPPVPPLPISRTSSLRMPSHDTEARHSSPPSQPTNHPTSSHAHSNSLTSLNSSSRRDHGHSKQGLRPRDSLVLKARHLDHLHTLPHNGRPSSVVDPAHSSVPPVPQLTNIPHPEKLKHTRHPSS